MKKTKVQDYSNLYRDLNNHAIINSCASEYEEYLRNCQIRNQKDSEIENLKTTVQTLSSEILEIKKLLQNILYGKS